MIKGLMTLFLLSLFTMAAYAAEPTPAAGTIVLNFGAPVTMTVPSEQRAKLDRYLAQQNAIRAEQGQSAITLEGWFQGRITGVISEGETAATQLESQQACASYKALPSQAAKQAALAPFGGNSPCP